MRWCRTFVPWKTSSRYPSLSSGPKSFRDLALNSRQYEAVKWGIAVGSLDEALDFAPPLFVFAQHSEFTVYAINALLQSYSRLPGFKQRVLELLPRLRQWGIIKSIELLLTTSDFAKDPIVQRECLINGMKYNDGIPMEIAFTLASQIDIYHFLDLSKADQRVLIAFSEMMNTLLTDPDPLGGLRDLPDPERLFRSYIELLESRDSDIHVLEGLRAAGSFLAAEDTQWSNKDRWLTRIRNLAHERTSPEVLRAGLKESSKTWIALQIIRENKLTDLLPDVEAMFVHNPDSMNIEVLRELGSKDHLERMFLKIPALVDLSARAGKQMSKVNLIGPEHKNAFEYAGIVKSLGRLGTPQAVAHLKIAFRDYDPLVRAAACDAVCDLDRQKVDLEISMLIEERLADMPQYVSDAAKRAAASIGLASLGDSPRPN